MVGGSGFGLTVATRDVGIAIASGVLLVSGVGKIVRPVPAIGLLRTLVKRAGTGLVRLLATVEIALAMSAWVVGGRVVSIVVALAFSAFAVVAARAVRAGQQTSCGCFGASSTPPSYWLVAGDVALAAGSGLSALAGPRPVLAAGPALWFVAAVAVWLLIAVMTLLPGIQPSNQSNEPRTFSIRGGR